MVFIIKENIINYVFHVYTFYIFYTYTACNCMCYMYMYAYVSQIIACTHTFLSQGRSEKSKRKPNLGNI